MMEDSHLIKIAFATSGLLLLIYACQLLSEDLSRLRQCKQEAPPDYCHLIIVGR